MKRIWLAILLVVGGPVAACAEKIYASWSISSHLPNPVTLSTFDSATPWLPEVPFPNALVPEGSLEFDPVTQQIWGFYYFQCQFECPAPPEPTNIDPLTGSWSFVDLPGFHQPLEQDFDIDPIRRELRYFGSDGANWRYSINRLEALEDTPLQPLMNPRAVAHKPPAPGSSGVETYVIGGLSSQGSEEPWYYLARVGGPGGNPSASSGEVHVIGPIEILAERLWFDISENGTAYLAALLYEEPYGHVNKLYRVDLESGALEEIGDIVPPSDDPNLYFLSGIAVAPSSIGGGILAIPSLSPPGAVLFALVLVLVACRPILRSSGRPRCARPPLNS